MKELSGNGTTRTGIFVGTIEYSAPEQIEGREVDARTDVYALACVLYESLAGEAPFHRHSEVAVLNAHLHDTPPQLVRAAPELPAGLDQVIAKALSKSPLDRHGSCGEFVAAARAAAAERHVHRRRLAVSLGLLVVAGLVGAAVALGVRALVTGGSTRSPTRAAAPSLANLLMRSEDGRTLNDAAYALIHAGEYAMAIPFARKAMQQTAVDTTTHGYATFNLGLALFEVGRCAEALPTLHNALTLEPPGYRNYIRPWIARAERCVRLRESARAQSLSADVQSDLSRGP